MKLFRDLVLRTGITDELFDLEIDTLVDKNVGIDSGSLLSEMGPPEHPLADRSKIWDSTILPRAITVSV